MSKAKNERWTEQYAQTVLESGGRRQLSIAALADELGVSQQRIYWWRKRLQDNQAARKAGFVEVKLLAAPPKAFTITTRSGRTIKVWPGFDAAELARLLATVEAEC